MATATTTRAEFLKAAERAAIAADATLQARWGTAAGDTAQSTVLVAEADATAEASRQLALLSSALAEDRVTVEGLLWDAEGTTVAIDYRGPDGAYFGGADVVTMLVTRARVSLADGATTLTGFVQL